MEDFKQFFDLKQFDDQKLGEIEFVLSSPAYESTFKPYIEGVVRQLTQLNKDRSQARKDAYPDDFLMGGVILAEGLLSFFQHIIEETRMERMHASMETMTNDMLYDLKRERGAMKPVVGLDQSALPEKIDPAEDY